MRVLLTGASSFTGFWFARGLVAAGHSVVAPLRRAQTDGSGVMRAHRLAALANFATVIGDCPFGSAAFLELAGQGPWDLLCHHGAAVENYRSDSFDIAAALAANTRELPAVLGRLQTQGLRGVVLTGSIFEAGEGAGTMPLRAFSPYGVSKGLTAAVVAAWCDRLAIRFSKFVIANPFGPFEEPRFTHYLAASWRRGETPEVRTPHYVRDNIHVDLLAATYVGLCAQLGATGASAAPRHLAPSQYAESQGAFAQRFAAAVAAASGRPCPLTFADRRVFDEPAVRVATDLAVARCPDWDEGAAWTKLAAFYFKKSGELYT